MPFKWNRSGEPIHRRFIADIEYPRDAVTSYFLQPAQLHGVRIVWMLYCIFTLIASIVRWMISNDTALDKVEWLFMFTHCNFVGLMLYLAVTLVIGHRYLRKPNMDVSRSFAVFHSLLYTWNVTFHPIVVIVFWLFLSSNFTDSTSGLGRTVSVSMHGVSLVIVLAEVFLGAMKMNWIGILPVIFLIVVYALWALIYFLISNQWVYFFLDYTKPIAAVMYPGVLVATIVFFLLMMLVHKARDYLLRGKSRYDLAVPTGSEENIAMTQV